MGLLSAIGSFFSGDQYDKAYDAQIEAQKQAGNIISNAAGFKPWNITTGFGSSWADPSGQKAGYTLDPQLAKMRDLMYGGAAGLMPDQAASAFYRDMQGLAQQRALGAMGMSPEQAAGQEYNALQQIMAPQRATEEARLADTLFKTGRTGFGTSMGTGGYVNPQTYSLMQSRGLQDQQMAMSALDRARQKQQEDIKMNFGLAGQVPAQLASLFGLGNQVFGYGTGLEKLGMGVMDDSLQWGDKARQGALAQAQAQANALTNAADWRARRYAASSNQYGNLFDTADEFLGGWNPFSGLFSGGSSNFPM